MAGAPAARQLRLGAQSAVGLVLVGALVVGGALVIGQRMTAVPPTNPGGSLPPVSATPSGPRDPGSSHLTSIASAHLVSARWSPDSKHAALQLQAVDARTPTVQLIVDRSARTIKSVIADGLDWTSASTYRLTRIDESQNRKETVGQLDSTAEVATSSAVTADSCVIAAPNIAMTCSNDGSEIVVLKVTKEDITNSGWLEIVDAKSDNAVHEFHDAQTNDQAWVSISPDGQSLAFADANGSIWIADGSTGKSHDVATHEITDTLVVPAWLPDGRLLVPDVHAQLVRVFTAAGIGSSGDFPYGPMISASASGTIIAMAGNSTVITVAGDGKDAMKLDLQCTPKGPSSVYWSPDGTEAVLVCSQRQPDAQGDYNESAVLVTP